MKKMTQIHNRIQSENLFSKKTLWRIQFHYSFQAKITQYGQNNLLKNTNPDNKKFEVSNPRITELTMPESVSSGSFHILLSIFYNSTLRFLVPLCIWKYTKVDKYGKSRRKDGRKEYDYLSS